MSGLASGFFIQVSVGWCFSTFKYSAYTGAASSCFSKARVGGAVPLAAKAGVYKNIKMMAWFVINRRVYVIYDMLVCQYTANKF